MALRKRNLKIAVTTMAIVSLLASSASVNNKTYADSTITSIERTSENTTYIVQNEIEYIKDGQVTTTGYDKLRSMLSTDTVIEVKNGKTYMTLEFAKPETGDQYSMVDNITITVDGKVNNLPKNADENNRKYTVEIESLDSDIQLSYDVNATMGEFVYNKNFLMNVILEGISEGETEDNTPEVEEENDAVSGATTVVPDTSTGEVTENKIENGTYTITNKTEYPGNSSTGSEMVRSSLEKVSYVEVKDGEVYLTLEFKDGLYEQMENIKITVDGQSVSPSVNGRKYTFKVKSIDSNIGISAYIKAMGMNISYTVKLDESTIEKTSSSSTDGTTSGSTSGSSSSTNGSTSGSSSSTSESTSSSDTTTESTVKKGKLYTIENTVDHESETGKEMARKYLNSTSKVEEIDGQYYVTLTFTGSEFMQNHVIYVNGSKVSHTVAAKSGDSISLRFKVSSLSDTIKVGMYVVPMSKDIEFTVKLLEDTLTFVKEYEVSSDGSSTLPQTGSTIDGTMAMGVGTSLMALGTLLNRRKRR